MGIPIQNIYFLLCYAWNKLEARDMVKVEVDDKIDLYNLFAKLLIKATQVLLKRGIDKSYINCSDNIPGIKGKLEIAETLKRNIPFNYRTYCSFDEFSENILTNRILVSILFRLMRTKNISREYKYEIKKLVSMLSGITPVDLNKNIFKMIRLNRNNSFYAFVLNVCRIIFENTLPSETPGDWKFMDFTRDENKMNQLFEAFIFNFYRHEKRSYKVRREIIEWQLECSNSEYKSYLPIMKTDITLENKTEKIIIDAKYYRETMAIHFNATKVHSGNLYQLFSYLINQEDETHRNQSSTGILLYPTIEKDYDLHYSFNSHNIFIKTVNLNSKPEDIKERLLNIIQVN